VLVVRAFRLSIFVGVAALALSGCMRRSGPVMAVQPVSDLDTLAYGRPAYGPAAVPVAYAAPGSAYDAQYKLDAGDKLRIVVYGQEGLTNSYAISAGGTITMPLIGSVPARGQTPASLAANITGRLRNGFIREPSVAVEIESYRPFFILGEVAAPGQYPYVPNMSVESAIAIAGGFSPRAKRDEVTLTHTTLDGSYRAVVPLGTPINPGDTVLISERWF
jgi:polysaccharide export outer membrane protein